MSETTLYSPDSPEGVSDSFSFQVGEDKFGFKGELTEGKYSGMIRGTDGKEFAGLVEDLGGGRYRIEDWEGGRIIEPSAEIGQVAPATDVPVGLEDAATVAAMEAVSEPQPAPAPVVEAVAGRLPAEVIEPALFEPPVAEIPEPMAEPAVEPEAATAEAAVQPASLVESIQQVVSEMKSMVAAKDMFDRKAAGKLLTAVEIAQMKGQDGILIEARLQELKQKASDLLAKIQSKVAVRDLQEKRKSGLLLTAVEIATIKTAESINDEEYAELKRLEPELEAFSALVPEKPQDEAGGIGEPPTVPEDPVAQIRRKQAEGKLLTQWELAQLRLADEVKTSSPEAVTVAEPSVLPEEGAPVEMPEPLETETVPEVMTAPGLPVIEAAEESPVPEAVGETPELRFERRKQGFAGALAELDRARNDTSGTERDQKVRLAEAFNQSIGAAMEFLEEGDEARAVVKEFLSGALGTPGGRKLAEIAVRSRMDNAGVFQAATPEERKKKLEETGLLGLLTLLLELGMSFTDASVQAVVSEIQSATGGGR